MRNLILSVLIFIGTITVSKSQKNDYNLPIADSLKQNANAVIRFSHTTYERTAIDKYKETIHCAITVLNSKGNSFSEIKVGYDQNSKVTDIWAIGYNNKGVRVKETKKKDFIDVAAFDGFSLFTDARLKYFSWELPVYPYTIEYSYTIENTGIVAFSGWNPQEYYNLSVENASLTYKTIPDLSFNVKIPENKYETTESSEPPFRTTSWQAKNIKAETYEELSESPSAVLLSPNKISFEGSYGDFSDWKGLGLWSYRLIQGRDILPVATIEKIKQLTANLPTEKDKIKAVYQYMQNKTRYVNVALGIGGFQPIMASEVDAKGYGDCKALSNYTKALLSTIGIESFYTVIGSGSSREIVYPDFASINQANHVILCVPQATDTVWLECTSQKMPFGNISTSNSDRYALLITPEGGKLVKTPVYKTDLNTVQAKAEYEIGADASIKFNYQAEFNHSEFEDVFGLIQASAKDQKDFLLENIGIPSPTIEQFSFADESADIARGTMKLNGSALKYATKMGKRVLLPINYVLDNTTISSISDKRTRNLYRRIGFSYSDQLIIKLPANYTIENIPANSEFNSVFGTYSLSYQKSEKSILITRKLALKAGVFKKESFAEINIFLKNISKADKDKIILSEI